jgi:hypothetical protein
MCSKEYDNSLFSEKIVMVQLKRSEHQRQPASPTLMRFSNPPLASQHSFALLSVHAL